MATKRAQEATTDEAVAGGGHSPEPDYASLEAEDFLELIWGKRSGWVDLPAKVAGYWAPFYLAWPKTGICPSVVSRRIDSCLRDGEDLYFSVAMFEERGRDSDDFMATSWLWADLDEVHPEEAARSGLLPTIAWESSPGRYQALWRLDSPLAAKPHERINRALSYHLTADRGGWDLTQVLRVPGTRNFKYPDAPAVTVLWIHEDLSYDPRAVWAKVRQHDANLSTAEVEGTSRRVRGPLPARARSLLRVGPDEVVAGGDRSARLWEIECLLAEAGWGEDGIYEVVAESAWNKWARVRTGERRLRREIRKSLQHVARKRLRDTRDSEPVDTSREDDASEHADGQDDSSGGRGVEMEETATPSPFIRYATFMAMEMEAPRWLIEGIWTSGSHGIVGGEPKTNKSTVMLAAGLSIASGKPFLNKYPVHVSGPVLMIQEENAPWLMQDRMRKIAASYGLISKRDVVATEEEGVGSIAKKRHQLDFPAEVPFRLLNNFGFDLSQEEHRDMLWSECAAIRPVMVILDPMYLILGGVDTDKMKDLQPYLKWLIALRYEFDCAVVMVHHFRKAPTSRGNGQVVRPGQRLLGSTTFHGWSECSLYLSDNGSEKGMSRVRVEREFRNVAPEEALELDLWMGKPGSLDFASEVRGFNAEDVLLRIITAREGITALQVGEMLGWDKRTVLSRARGTGLIDVRGGKKGRGHTHRLYLAEQNGDGSGDD